MASSTGCCIDLALKDKESGEGKLVKDEELEAEERGQRDNSR